MTRSQKQPAARERLLQEMEETAGPLQRLTIDVDALLAVRMKRQARAEERTLSEITRELWIDYLRKYAEE